VISLQSSSQQRAILQKLGEAQNAGQGRPAGRRRSQRDSPWELCRLLPLL